MERNCVFSDSGVGQLPHSRAMHLLAQPGPGSFSRQQIVALNGSGTLFSGPHCPRQVWTASLMLACMCSSSPHFHQRHPLHPLSAMAMFPLGVAIMLRTTPPPEGMDQVSNVSALGSKRTSVFGRVPDSLYQIAAFSTVIP